MSLHCRPLYDTLALPIIPIVQGIGYRGLFIDNQAKEELASRIALEIFALDGQLAAYGITEANSTRKLAQQLLALKVPLSALTKSGANYKIDGEVLGKLNHKYNTIPLSQDKQPRFPFFPLLIKRARLAKAGENLSALVTCNDGFLRTSLKACHTSTARYASSGFGRAGQPGWCPICQAWGRHGTNLQNITRGCALCGSSAAACTCEGGGIHIKSVFRSLNGWKLAELDYSALELRIMAYAIGCEKLIGRLEEGAPLHDMHARLMFPEGEVTKRRRTLAKNFIYTVRGAGGDYAIQSVLAKQGEYVAIEEIARWRKVIFAEYPEIAEWIKKRDEGLKRQMAAGQRCLIYNGLGRPRIFLGNNPLKELLAFEISSTAADIMSFVALRLATQQPDIMRHVVMQIHDSFLVHAPEKTWESVTRAVQEEMERPVWHWGRFATYPTEVKVGERWSTLSPLDIKP